MKFRACELCNGEAALYCASDSAFLCFTCDGKVHGANFLVARHVRQTICSQCKDFDGNCVSGTVVCLSRPVCRSCSPESVNDDSISSSSSACISSTSSFINIKKNPRREMDKILSSSSVTENSGENMNFCGEVTSKKNRAKPITKILRSRVPAKVDAKAEDIFVNWCRKMGLDGNCNIPTASQALSVCLSESTVSPFRVALAASFWFSVRACRGSAATTDQNLKKLEEISGVPAKLILTAQTKLARVLSVRNDQQDQEEGWAECSV